MIDEYLYEVKEDYFLLASLNMSEKEILDRVHGWTKTEDSDYEIYL